MRKVKFINGEYYHIFNRGVDKRNVYLDEGDFRRFLRSMQEFNRLEPIGSLYEKIYKEKVAQKSNSQLGIGFRESSASQRLVEFIAYCLLPNHYHFILKQLVDDGISKYLHKVGLGYTNFFNLKNQRLGALFQGKFKAVQIDSDEHLLWATAYVNGNAQIHGLIPDAAEYEWCSYPEYLGKSAFGVCNKNIILDKFKDAISFREANDECFNQMRERKELPRYMPD